jgi:hypothetical protein
MCEISGTESSLLDVQHLLFSTLYWLRLRSECLQENVESGAFDMWWFPSTKSRNLKCLALLPSVLTVRNGSQEE